MGSKTREKISGSPAIPSMGIGEMSALGGIVIYVFVVLSTEFAIKLASGEGLADFLGKISVACTDLPSGSCAILLAKLTAIPG